MSGNLTNLERVISKNPTSSLFARLADACLRQGDVNRAIEICRQGLRYRPSYVSGHVVLGKSHFAAGMFEEARRAFNKVLHLDPHHTVAIWYLGQIDRTMGWDDLALRNFQKARDLDPLSQSLQNGIDEILASISSQMGQKLLNEVRREDADPVHRLSHGSGRLEMEEARLQSRPEAGICDEPQSPEPLPSTPAVDPPAPKKTAISRLLEEIETGIPPVAEPEVFGEPVEAGMRSVGTTAEMPVKEGIPARMTEDTEEEMPGDALQVGEGKDSEERVPPQPDVSPVLPQPAGEDPGKASPGVAEETAPSLANRRGGGRRSGGDRLPRGTSGGGGRPGKSAPNGASGGGSGWEDIPITTSTLAEIYAGQGLITQALAIFEKVLEREPDNARVRERLSALRAQQVPNAPPS
ncbi:MAG: tetratricopeptide repeat protein [Candidatus Latescibacteria bacterium]|nr:tetratricopeptide repeat protein [Candidatus Latescibacterota bacterium]